MASNLVDKVLERPGYERVHALITVKAYPVLSRQFNEAVCVAGVRLDRGEPEWLRLFPVGFRALPRDRQFKKYQYVALRAQRRSSDQRPESLFPDLGSLVLGETLGTDGATWSKRWEVLGELAGQTTMCELNRGAKEYNLAAPSLGLIEVADVSDVSVVDNSKYKPGGDAIVEVDLFGHEESLLEAAPFIVHYKYRCTDRACDGHNQSIVDWESGILARRNIIIDGRSLEDARRLQRERFFDQMCSPDKDLHFFVGNQAKHAQSFLVLGVFYPKRGHRPHPQLDLF